MSSQTAELQRQIAIELQVTRDFDASVEIERRVAFLAGELTRTSLRALIMGISGGVDSSTAGRLCQLAVERVRAGGGAARFIAMRLPYGQQRDEADAQAALAFVQPDAVLTVDIQPAVDASMRALAAAEHVIADPHLADFVRGNVKARERMVAQYAIANAEQGLVVGTDHAAEAVMGFFTKHGDGACDLAPLTGLTKRRVRMLAAAMEAPDRLVHKMPTADLETLRPLHPDEAALGCSYDAIDDFLELKLVEERAAALIIATYHRTAHKRAGPKVPS
jgi:NAD+ synthase